MVPMKTMPTSFLLFMICCGSVAVSAQPYSSKLSWARNDGNKRVVVFVHGFLGNARSSWLNPDTNLYWPGLLAKEVADTDVAIWEYPTDLSGSDSIPPDYAADSLERQLGGKEGVLSRSEVIFIAHSLGGVVVRAALLRHPRVLEKTRMVLFFSSPGLGSIRASVGRRLLPNPIYDYLRRRSSYLKNQVETWYSRGIPNRLESLCFFETNPTESLVNYDSALALCEKFEIVPGTHSSIVKPKDEKADSHLEVLEALESLAASTNAPCQGPVAVGASHISTNSSNARIVSGDSELDSDDWTSVELSYSLEVSADKRQVDLRVVWFAQERNSNRSPGDTRIGSEKTITIFRLSEECGNSEISQLEGVVQRATMEQFYRGRLRDLLDFPATGSMKNIRVQVDARGGADHHVQALEGVLPGFTVLLNRTGDETR